MMYYPLLPTNLLGDLAEILIQEGGRKVIKFLTEKEVVKATRRLYKGKIDSRSKHIEILFTIGVPNYEERKLIKEMKKAGEPFPIKKIKKFGLKN